MTFEEWLRTVCFQKPTNEAYDLAKTAWDAATTAERNRCEEKCEELANDNEPPYKEYEDTYLNGWLDACNECKWAIHRCVDIWAPFTEEEPSKAAIIDKAYYDNNKPIDIQITGDGSGYYQKIT